MTIDWMEYENASTGQVIRHIDFLPLTLLVGPSAAGKTEILKILSSFLVIAVRSRLIPAARCHFRMGFHIGAHTYRWDIATGDTQAASEDDIPGYAITSERLDETTPGQERWIFQRSADKLTIRGFEKLPMISAEKSALSMYKETPPMKDIVQHFSVVSSYEQQANGLRDIPARLLENVRATLLAAKQNHAPIRLHALHGSSWPIALDIYVARTCMPETYQAFLEDVQEIFPEIEDISIGQPLFETSRYLLDIRQDGKDILQDSISSGMLRTIFLLGTLRFRAQGSLGNVIFYDELENSLGINCLDEIVDRIRLQAAEAGTQFLLTSHHPYIINNIPVKNWLLVSQSHGIISTRNPETVGIGAGYREQFFELMNYYEREERRRA